MRSYFRAGTVSRAFERIPQRYRMSTAHQPTKEPLIPGTSLRSDSGCSYKIEETLIERRKPLLCVYRASAGEKKYIVKNMIPGEFEYQLDLQKRLSVCPNVRAVTDTVKSLEMFIYPFLKGDLLRLSPRLPSKKARIEVLRCALRGLHDMHKENIAHNDVKADNIMIDYEENAPGHMDIKSVQIADLEDTVLLPVGNWIKGTMCGNAIWRSPESWCRARQNISSDIFSFGIVMIYVMADEMVFRVGKDKLEAEDSWHHVLRRHVSYFADEDGLNGFLKHIGKENPFYERFVALASSFGPGEGRQPFQTWNYIDPDLRDLVGKMTSLDPVRRITAGEALEHRWFRQAD
ncbi:hypothetical protein McaMca56_003632 [Microsporum canis]